MEIGDVCRTSTGAPARYIGNGKALYISPNNDMCINDATSPEGNEDMLPLPSDEDVDIYSYAVDYYGTFGMKIGDVCRTIAFDPARYIGKGKALFFTEKHRVLRVSDVAPLDHCDGNETKFTLPSDEQVAFYSKTLRDDKPELECLPQWSSAPPTETGYYWRMRLPGPVQIMQVVIHPDGRTMKMYDHPFEGSRVYQLQHKEGDLYQTITIPPIPMNVIRNNRA